MQRLHSQYKHWVQETGYKRSFEDFLDEHPGAVERGKYFKLLQPYLDRFPRENLSIVIFEDLVTRPGDSIAELYSFLGVSPDFVPENLTDPANVSTVPRFHPLYVQVKRVTRTLQHMGGAKLIDAAKNADLQRFFGSSRGESSCPVSEDTSGRLKDAYREDVDQMCALLGRDLHYVWPPFSDD